MIFFKHKTNLSTNYSYSKHFNFNQQLEFYSRQTYFDEPPLVGNMFNMDVCRHGKKLRHNEDD